MNELKSILASRFARSGQWEKMEGFNSHAKVIAKHLEQANDNTLSARERAENYFDAAELIAAHCKHLFNSNPLSEYYLPLKNDVLTKRREHVLSKNARKRIEENLNGPECRLSHWYVAADLMKQCADLLPNNDVLAAEALFLGGSYLKYRDPKSADPFYKALVRRNSNLLIAKQADELRWFPKEFTDVVLYTPRIKPLLPRKRTLTLRFAAVTLILSTGVVLVVLAKRARKRKQNISENGE